MVGALPSPEIIVDAENITVAIDSGVIISIGFGGVVDSNVILGVVEVLASMFVIRVVEPITRGTASDNVAKPARASVVTAK